MRCATLFPHSRSHARAEHIAPAQPEEYFFCCTWAFHEASGAAVLLFAGQKGVIRILDANAQALCQVRALRSTRTLAPPRAGRMLTAFAA